VCERRDRDVGTLFLKPQRARGSEPHNRSVNDAESSSLAAAAAAAAAAVAAVVAAARSGWMPY